MQLADLGDAPICMSGYGDPMPDHIFEDRKLASLYDLFAPADSRADFSFYLPMIQSAKSVLDIGCGTGSLLIKARDAGHTGRLTGIDPASGMIEVAKARSDFEWMQTDVLSTAFDQEFDLAVMTGHAFQVLLEDDEIRKTFSKVHGLLAAGGRFAFETRNPLVRSWESWHVEYSGTVTDQSGVEVKAECKVEEPVAGDLVRFSHTYSSQGWSSDEINWSTLRFISLGDLNQIATDAEFEIESQFGDWDSSEYRSDSPEIITILRKPD